MEALRSGRMGLHARRRWQTALFCKEAGDAGGIAYDQGVPEKDRHRPSALQAETVLPLDLERPALHDGQIAGIVQIDDVRRGEKHGGVATFAAFRLPLDLTRGGVESDEVAFTLVGESVKDAVPEDG